jgi:putative GTP pyrophosphokinase
MIELEGLYHRCSTQALQPLAVAIKEHLRDCLADETRIDRVTARTKAVDRFVAKARKVENNRPKYDEPLRQIQDQIGARHHLLPCGRRKNFRHRRAVLSID